MSVETPIKDSINLRRHKGACQYYREDWTVNDALYRIVCLMNTPPQTEEEQDLCMCSRSGCWRLRESPRQGSRRRPSTDE
ncbi:MAG: hypothetical protein HY329_21625 [Chloroflexi bacterium]|nr:hypothetical protein [Chloroflexota bacterium]